MGGTTFAISLWDVNTVSWVFGSVAIALTAGRYLIRWKLTCAFHADDIAHLFAVLFMVAELSCYQALVPMLYTFYDFADGVAPEDDALFNKIEGISFVEHILFYCSLWCVKLAFLLFYRTLFGVNRKFNLAWWAVLAFNFVTFWMAIVGCLLLCQGKPQLLTDWKTCEDPIAADDLRKIYIFTFVSVVTSDLLVMALPLAILPSLKLRKGQKLAIAGIFCLSFVSIAMETLRLAKSFIGGNTLNVLWIHLEEVFAVLVSALPSYYSLIHWKNGTLKSSRMYASSSAARLRSGDKSGNHSTMRGNQSHMLESRSSDNSYPTERDYERGIKQTYEIQLDVVDADDKNRTITHGI